MSANFANVSLAFSLNNHKFDDFPSSQNFVTNLVTNFVNDPLMIIGFLSTEGIPKLYVLQVSSIHKVSIEMAVAIDDDFDRWCESESLDCGNAVATIQ